jgi:hypothetical protein
MIVVFFMTRPAKCDQVIKQFAPESFVGEMMDIKTTLPCLTLGATMAITIQSISP